jgi:transcriptional regulator with XRE-family HTH domain
MVSIKEIFSAGMRFLVPKMGSQADLAAKTELKTGALNHYFLGRREGDELTRRKIAAALGYPGRQYEDFLDIGRAILAEKDPTAVLSAQKEKGVGPSIHAPISLSKYSPDAPEWLNPFIGDLKNMSSHEQNAIIAIIKAFRKSRKIDANTEKINAEGSCSNADNADDAPMRANGAGSNED